MTDSRWDRPPEHHFELGEAEHERVGAIDQHDFDVGAELVGQSRRELQTREARAQHHDPHRRDSTHVDARTPDVPWGVSLEGPQRPGFE